MMRPAARGRLMIPVMLALAFGLVLGTVTPASSQTSGSTSTLADAGVLRLRLGAQDHFRYEPPPPASASTQAVSAGSACRLSLGSPNLVSFSSTPSGSQAGFFGDAIGVRTNTEGGGTPCGQINPGQTLTMNLGSGLSGKVIDFAEIDVEGKFGATFKIDGYFVDGSTPTLIASETYETQPGGSDSGPDSGDADNFRVRFPKDGKTTVNRLVFSIVGSTGAASLEGGSDGTEPCDASDGCDADDPSLGQELATTDTLFHLIEADGVLDCGDDPVSQTNGGITTTVARLDNVAGATCTPIAYNQDSSTGTNACDPNNQGFLQCIFLQKDLDEQQARFFWKVEWAPEAGSYMEQPTEFDFGDGFVPLQLCGPSTGQVTDPPTGFPTFYPTPSSDPWCVVNTQTVLQANGKVVVTEIFFGVADPTGRR